MLLDMFRSLRGFNKGIQAFLKDELEDLFSEAVERQLVLEIKFL